MERPALSEYAPFYQKYVDKVPEGDIISVLEYSKHQLLSLLENTPADKYDYRYAEGKWSMKETLLHMIDAERVFSYRALRIARKDQTPLSGFDQDAYVPVSEAAQRTWQSLIDEYKAVRDASIHLFKNISEEASFRLGMASNAAVSVRALAYITAGHELHHLHLFIEKYLNNN